MTAAADAPRPVKRVTAYGRLLWVSGVVLLCAWVIVPIYLLAINALSSPGEVAHFPKSFVPSFDTGSLAFFMDYSGVAAALWNSVLTAVITMVLSIAIGAPAGYALSRFDFRGKGAFRVFVVMTRAFPLPLLALPLAVAYLRLGIDDTPAGLALVHTMLAMPFAVLITFSLFAGIPLELEEAAWTLGCDRLQAFRRVVAPLVLPGLAAAAVFAFTISWNEVFAAAVLTVQHQTLPAFLVQNLNSSPLPLKFAGGAALVVPALVFIFAVRKYLFAMWGISNR